MRYHSRYFVKLFLGALKIIAVLILTVLMVKSARADPLEHYIGKHCNKGCVDSQLLRMSLLYAKEQTGVDPHLMLAVIKVESGFKQKALNRKNGRSVGLSQVQVKWHTEKFATQDQYDVFDNIRVGAVIFKACEEKHKGNRKRGLWCYNGHQKRGLQQYAEKVLRILAQIKQNGIRI